MDPDQKKLYEAITQGARARGLQHFALTDDLGRLRGPFADFLLSPTVGMALQALGSTLRYDTELSAQSSKLITFHNGRWPYFQLAFLALFSVGVNSALGFKQHELEAIRQEDMTPFDGVESRVGRTVLALLDGDLDESAWHDAEEILGKRTVFELTTLVGYYSTLALQLRVFQVESEAAAGNPIDDVADRR